MDNRSPIDIHIRISRRLALWTVAIIVGVFALSLVWMALQTVGSTGHK